MLLLVDIVAAERGFCPGASPIDLGAKSDESGSPQLRGTAMKPDYDFSKGERGKYFRPNSELRLPIYLNADVQT